MQAHYVRLRYFKYNIPNNYIFNYILGLSNCINTIYPYICKDIDKLYFHCIVKMIVFPPMQK